MLPFPFLAFSLMKKIAGQALTGVELVPKILIEASIDLSDIDDKLLEALEKFEPFGGCRVHCGDNFRFALFRRR